MPKLKFTQLEIEKMKQAAVLGHNGWTSPSLADIKKKIKSYKRENLGEICCYCQRDTTSEFSMVLDIEHIIPKSVRVRHMFTMKNLSVSCKRCNMQIKKADTSFLVFPIDELPIRVFKSKYYKFIHPNLDNIEEHLELNISRKGRARIIKYLSPNHSEKGIFTYKYFKLRELEIDAANKAQGRTKKTIRNETVATAFEKLTR